MPRTGSLLLENVSQLENEWDIKVTVCVNKARLPTTGLIDIVRDKMQMSSVELYQERFKDLLKGSFENIPTTPKKQPRNSRSENSKQGNVSANAGRRSSVSNEDTLRLREDPSSRTHLEGVSEHTVENAEQLKYLMTSAADSRASCETSMNKVCILKTTFVFFPNPPAQWFCVRAGFLTIARDIHAET